MIGEKEKGGLGMVKNNIYFEKHGSEGKCCLKLEIT